MKNYNEVYIEENEYLSKTLEVITNEIAKESGSLTERKNSLLSARRDMWENTAHFSSDFNKMTEINQHLTELTSQTATYTNTLKRIQKLKRMVDSPYFGRFDFKEEGSGSEERIYIGLYNLMDSKTHEIFVYDWRAPVSSIFYRFEPGLASYNAPCGEITGEVLMKRQYKIQESNLKYFFDCSIRINDEILQEVLSRNSSVKMRNIVETIQKEQDNIIRDSENELLIVQGVAGSGKTSIALHRIAFLLYEGIESKLDSNNIIVISPNVIFSKYISSVLPELGEDNVEQITVDEILKKYLGEKTQFETRGQQLERIISCREGIRADFLRKSVEFKGSSTFAILLERLLRYFEHKLIEFEDVYYNGKVILNKQELKNSFLNGKLSIPMAKRLKRMENIILDRVNPVQAKRLERIEKLVEQTGGHEFEIKSYSRLLSMKDSKVLMAHLHKFTEVDPYNLYKRLFTETDLFVKLSSGLELPDNIGEIISETIMNLNRGRLLYEDATALLYLKLKIEGNNLFSEIKQVVIDEAQDYHPLNYEIFKILFNNSRYTVMGDVCQSIEKNTELTHYDDIVKILDKKKTVKLFLNKSYRASYEINFFANKLLGEKQDFISFERHEEKPEIIHEETLQLLEKKVRLTIESYLDQGFETIAVICKTMQKAKELYSILNGFKGIILLETHVENIEKGVMIVPVYLAKGLEFDAVLVYGVDSNDYIDEYDRKLLYVCCTRALHRLSLFYTGKKSPLLKS